MCLVFYYRDLTLLHRESQVGRENKENPLSN